MEIGDGFAAAELSGEENADEMRAGPSFLSNHAGGVLGGLSTGQAVVVRFADRHGANADAGVVAALGDDLRLLPVAVDGAAGREDR